MAEYEFIRGATGRILQVRVIPSADTARMRYNVIILKRRARLMRVLGASELAESIEEVLDSLAAYQGALDAMIRDERAVMEDKGDPATDRYQVRPPSGEPGIRTNSLREAEKWAEKWKTEVIEVEAS